MDFEYDVRQILHTIQTYEEREKIETNLDTMFIINMFREGAERELAEVVVKEIVRIMKNEPEDDVLGSLMVLDDIENALAIAGYMEAANV